MGLSESCRVFEELSTALEWAAYMKLGASGVVHILDDFLFIEHTRYKCGRILLDFQLMCQDIGIPLAPDKTFGPDQIMLFLGLILDTIRMEARLPLDKLTHCRELIHAFQSRKKVTLKELQSLIGTLQFATSVVVPGKAFLRRLIDLTIGIRYPHYKIRLTNEARADLQMWSSFLDTFNGSNFFLPERWLLSDELHLFTDASSVGFGAVFHSEWLYGTWSDSITRLSLPITVLEFYPIVAALVTWGLQLRNQCVWFYTDNHALVPIINKQSSRNKVVMRLMRIFVLHCLRNNILFRAVHISGHHNVLEDALSRLQVSKFKKLLPHASVIPPPVQAMMDPELLLKP